MGKTYTPPQKRNSGTAAESKLDRRIADAEGRMQAAFQSRDKAERGRKAAQADNARLRTALAEMTAERDALAARLNPEATWGYDDATDEEVLRHFHNANPPTPPTTESETTDG